MALTEKTITVNGAQVRYLEDGAEQGREVVLIHGGIGGARLHWAEAMPLLADQYHVIAPDLPGFGGSDLLPNMGIDALVTWLGGVLDALELSSAVLVGNSFGALIVRAFATVNPRRVPAVILVNGGIIPQLGTFIRFIARTPVIGNLMFNSIGRAATSRQTLDNMIHVKSVLTDAFISEAANSAQSYGRLLQGTAANPVPEKLAPPTPVLLLWGTEDKLVSVSDGQGLKTHIPGATFSEVTDVGHMVQLEEPDVFAGQVKSFLGKISKPRGPSVGILSPR